MLPNYLVIGAPKCATTSLCQMLGSHPQIFMTTPKEPDYFSRPECHARGLAWYEGLFDGADGALAVGEGSTTYTGHAHGDVASERIAEAVPGARLIYCVRHPLRRIESGWLFVRSRGRRPMPSDFEEALCRSEQGEQLIGTTLYWRQLNLYRRFFDDDRIRVVFFEDFARDAAAVARGCVGFLGADPGRLPADGSPHVNSARDRRRPTPLARALSTLPIGRRVARRLPSRLMSRPEQKPVWTRRAYEHVVGLLRDDASRLLDHCGRPGSWDLDEADIR